MQVKKAIIPCAGFGTRFLPITKVLPKELFPIVDTPALCYIIDEAVKSGIEQIMVVVSPQKQSIKEFFEPNVALNNRLLAQNALEAYALANKDAGAKIAFCVQEEMTGNANAIKLCKDFANGEPVAVMFGDDVTFVQEGEKPALQQLIDAYVFTKGCTIVGCQKTDEEVARRCGVMVTKRALSEKITEIDGIIEKPEHKLPSALVSLGRFVLSPSIFDAIDETKPSLSGETYLTDAISTLAHKEQVYACEFDARRYDIGNKQGYLEAVVEFALRNKELGAKFKEYLKSLNLD